VKVLTRWTDLIEAMAGVVAGAREPRRVRAGPKRVETSASPTVLPLEPLTAKLCEALLRITEVPRSPGG
jgi:hypothetical protein